MSKSSLENVLRILIAVSLLVSIVACGQKGDLVRPGMNASSATNASAVNG